ncbi:hypothetical protein [Actinokineospora terrae]|nr:hypothetical protein [Actinokineospora terrae]
MLYAKASEAGRDSLERYLKYYQVLEYFMPRASEDLKLAQNANSMRKTLTPYPIGDENRDNLGIERNKLEAVIDAATTSVQVIGFLMGGPTLSVLSNARVLQDVHALPADPAGKIISGVIYQKEVAKRVYAIRCRIVHTKEEFNNGHVGPLLPYGREARDLEPDIGLVRFLAERALQHWSQPLS